MRTALLIAAAGLLIGASTSFAQSSSLFGNRGVNASSGSLSNGVGANQGNTPGNAGSMTGFTGAGAGSQQGFASGVGRSSSLAGRGNSGNFVGNSSSVASATGAGGQPGQAGGANRGGLSGGRNSLGGGLSRNNNGQQNRGNRNGGAASGAQSTPIRPVLVIAFDAASRTGASIESSLGSDIASATAQGRMAGFVINADSQGTVTLQGQVATESERRKAERLARLEPGVRNVVNKITVTEQP